jgi:hypothetical protein
VKMNLLFCIGCVCAIACKSKNETTTSAAPSASAAVLGQPFARASSPADHFHPVPPPSAAPELTAQQELDQLLRPLTASGEATSELTAKFTAARTRWLQVVREWRVTFDEAACYQRGCALTTSAPDARSLEEATMKMTQDSSFNAWAGGKFRSGILEDPKKPGRKQATWIFYVE